jgi:hypothetical protein
MKITKEIVEQDLSRYNQFDEAPKTLTLGENTEDWRHYELDMCFGLVAYCESYYFPGPMHEKKYHVLISVLGEDDGHYFLEDGVQTCDGSWLKLRARVYERMHDWLEKNCRPKYIQGMEGTESAKCGFEQIKTIES